MIHVDIFARHLLYM